MASTTYAFSATMGECVTCVSTHAADKFTDRATLMRLLLVEDDETLSASLASQLKQAGYAVDCAADGLFSHVRLRIYPDGGVARLRVYGIPALAPAEGPIDLASALSGGQVVALSNGHYGHQRLLAPGRGVNMGDGWETSRRREPGHEWIVVRLAARATVESIVVDTAHFKGNYPDACSVQAADLTGTTGDLPTLGTAASMFWQEILPEQKLAADRIHTFDGDRVKRAGAVTHIRLNIHPDGGISRLRVFGRVAEGGKT